MVHVCVAYSHRHTDVVLWFTTEGVQSSHLGRVWRTQGRWVEEHIDDLDAEGLRQLVLVLDQENPELYKWLTQQEPAPAHMVRTLTARETDGQACAAHPTRCARQ